MTPEVENDGPIAADLTKVPETLHMLSTLDNPYNPFTHWDEWFAYDSSKGYYTPGYLARIANTSDEMSQADLDLALEQAILDICRENVNGLYIRVPEPKTTTGDQDISV